MSIKDNYRPEILSIINYNDLILPDFMNDFEFDEYENCLDIIAKTNFITDNE